MELIEVGCAKGRAVGAGVWSDWGEVGLAIEVGNALECLVNVEGSAFAAPVVNAVGRVGRGLDLSDDDA